MLELTLSFDWVVPKTFPDFTPVPHLLAKFPNIILFPLQDVNYVPRSRPVSNLELFGMRLIVVFPSTSDNIHFRSLAAGRKTDLGSVRTTPRAKQVEQ